MKAIKHFNVFDGNANVCSPLCLKCDWERLCAWLWRDQRCSASWLRAGENALEQFCTLHFGWLMIWLLRLLRLQKE